MKSLDVYFHEQIIGQLIQDKHGDMSFTYSSNWLDNPHAIKISCSLPLQNTVFNKKTCQAFFGGILPEEDSRKLIAKNLGISANNDFSMLEKIGGECAGALSFLLAGEKIDATENSYHEITDAELAKILRELPVRPLLAGEKEIRLSLAGVQDKLAVYIENDKIFLPLKNSPSTHILKPDFNLYEGVIFNELFCLKLGNKVDLFVEEAEIRKIEDINCLFIKRFDRILSPHKTKKIQRLHQEDFCQALGILSTTKYQNEGGPSLKQCFDLIRNELTVPVTSLERMINAVIFNFLIGNCDAHGKNFSILYLPQLQLAPLYDLICTIYYSDLSKKMAMKIGGEYNINHVHPANFDKLADEIQFSKPEMRKRIVELSDKIIDFLPEIEIIHDVQEKVADCIKIRCENFSKDLRKK